MEDRDDPVAGAPGKGRGFLLAIDDLSVASGEYLMISRSHRLGENGVVGDDSRFATASRRPGLVRGERRDRCAARETGGRTRVSGLCFVSAPDRSGEHRVRSPGTRDGARAEQRLKRSGR